MIKRWKILGICIFTVMGLLVLRLAYIQLAGHEDLSAAAASQQMIRLDGADTRGTIYDRNGTPLAGSHQEYVYIIEADNVDGETLNALNQVYAEEISGNGRYRVFSSDIYVKTIGDRLIENSGAYIIETGRRYTENQPAAHIIGYVNKMDNSGASGLELKYDKQLAGVSRRVSAAADVEGTLLQGKGLYITETSEYAEGITTTLDTRLQKKAEELLDLNEYNGAVVITKVETGEILAAASTPSFDPYDIESYIGSTGGELINKVTQGEYPPGSVFKIVVAAAALENGISSKAVFECSGSVTIAGQEIRCNTGGEEGHGTITLEEAFADSCNCTFVKLGQKIGAEKILETAEKLGLGSVVLDGFPDEKDGNLMTIEQSGGSAIGNLSIGQGELLATPLQIAAMTGIIAKGGISTGLYLVEEQNDDAENVRCISYETASAIMNMMTLTISEGTGRFLSADISMSAKTGSAESSRNGAETVHGWITGFVPSDDPEYVITVFVEDGKSGSGSAGPVFAELAQFIYESHMLEKEVNI